MTASQSSEASDLERVWLQKVYRADAPQLTLRAALVGAAIGALMALSNVYVVLRTGFSLGLTLTACLLAFAAFEGFRRLRPGTEPLGLLENNLVGSVASAAGFMTGGGNLAAVAALMLLTGSRPEGWWLVAWFTLVAALGVVVAIPIKRLLINREQLPFPSAVATAETLRAMHERGVGDAPSRPLLLAGLVSAVLTLARDARQLLPGFPSLTARLTLPFPVAPALAATWGLDVSPMLLGSGSLMGLRTAGSLVLGALLAHGLLSPWLLTHGVIVSSDFSVAVQAVLWPGAALLTASGLVALVFQLAGMVRWLAASWANPGAWRRTEPHPADAVETPVSWFLLGLLLLSPPTLWLMGFLFGVPLWAALLAIPLALVAGVVSGRVTGETDFSPTKALGPATQLLYGVLLPGQVTANIMSANVTGGVGLHAGDLLTDLKTGWLLGASPRKQFLAQLLGVLVGALVVVPVFAIVIPSADQLGTERYPAPSVLVWASVSRVMTTGLVGLAEPLRWLILAGGVAGALLAVAEQAVPKSIRGYLPSPAALGIAMVLPPSMTLTMGLGAVVATVIRHRWPLASRRLIPVASGLIAGESLLGVGVALGGAWAGG